MSKPSGTKSAPKSDIILPSTTARNASAEATDFGKVLQNVSIDYPNQGKWEQNSRRSNEKRLSQDYSGNILAFRSLEHISTVDGKSTPQQITVSKSQQQSALGESKSTGGLRSGKQSASSVADLRKTTPSTYDLVQKMVGKDSQKKEQEKKRLEEEARAQQEEDKRNQEETKKLRLSENKKPKNSVEKQEEGRVRYSLAEDISMLNYIKSKPNTDNYTSKNFWSTAINHHDFLGKKRSVDSLRDRYRLFLRYLDADDLQRIEDWKQVNGDRGYLQFKTAACKDQKGKILHVKKLDLIELETENSINIPKKYKSAKQPKKKTQMEKELEMEEENEDRARLQSSTTVGHTRQPLVQGSRRAPIEDDIEALEEEEEDFGSRRRQALRDYRPKAHEFERGNFAGSNHIHDILEGYEQRPTERRPATSRHDLLLDESRESLNELEIEEQEDFPMITSITQTRNRKRKEFAGKYDLQNQQRPLPKKIRETPSVDHPHSIAQEDNEDRVKLRADWLRELAQRYNVGSEEMLDLFYFCSMNSKILTDYLEGAEYLKWNDDEDSLLQSGLEEAVRVLCRYKTKENVRLRLEFLERCEHLEKEQSRRGPLSGKPRQISADSKKVKLTSFL